LRAISAAFAFRAVSALRYCPAPSYAEQREFWNAIPIPAFPAGCPPRRAREVRSSRIRRIDSREQAQQHRLAGPEGPNSATISPFSTLSDTSFRTVSSLNDLPKISHLDLRHGHP